jgi:hypothetical protein
MASAQCKAVESCCQGARRRECNKLPWIVFDRTRVSRSADSYVHVASRYEGSPSKDGNTLHQAFFLSFLFFLFFFCEYYHEHYLDFRPQFVQRLADRELGRVLVEGDGAAGDRPLVLQ